MKLYAAKETQCANLKMVRIESEHGHIDFVFEMWAGLDEVEKLNRYDISFAGDVYFVSEYEETDAHLRFKDVAYEVATKTWYVSRGEMVLYLTEQSELAQLLASAIAYYDLQMYGE